MSKITSLFEGNAGRLTGVLAAGAIGLGGLLYWAGVFGNSENVQPGETELETPVQPDAASDQVETVAINPAVDLDADSVQDTGETDAESPQELAVQNPAEKADAAPEESAVSAVPEADPEPQPEVAPEFDVVRVEPDGTTLIAGKSAPEAEVVIFLDGEAFETVQSDSSGKFVGFVALPPSDTPRILSLVARSSDQEVASVQEIILAPGAPVKAPALADAGATAKTGQDRSDTAEVSQEIADPPAPAASAKEDASTSESVVVSALEPDNQPATTGGGTTSPAAGTPEEGDTQEPQPEQVASTDASGSEPEVTAMDPALTGSAQTTPEPANPVTVLRADADGVEVLQPAITASPEVMSSVALDAISYSDSGQVQLSGRSPAQGHVRVYLDNKPITTLPIDETGRWRGDSPEVDSGIYTLRIDQVNAEGDVTSRVETPFKREEPSVLSAAIELQENSDAPVRSVTVQAGSTLWAIARKRYGEGILYVRVFEANRDSIRDPDLIYPGQIFALPND